MNLELAVVQSCDEHGCLVRVVGEEAPLQTRYSAAVKDRVRVRRADLVAVDLAPQAQTPELVWRWRQGEVLQPLSQEPAPGHVLVGAHGCAMTAKVARPDLQPEVGEVVWLMGHEESAEVADRAVGGEPERPAWIRHRYFATIEATYAAMGGAG